LPFFFFFKIKLFESGYIIGVAYFGLLLSPCLSKHFQFFLSVFLFQSPAPTPAERYVDNTGLIEPATDVYRHLLVEFALQRELQ
jgi:hypothetical protein